MWVYGDDTLDNRLHMDAMVGFVLDYWLHLHKGDAYPVWRSRPLGVRALSDLITFVSLQKVGGRINSQIATEARVLYQLRDVLGIPGDIGTLPRHITPALVKVAEHIQGLDMATVRRLFIWNATSAAAKRDLSGCAFWIRRLAGELGDHLWSDTQIATRAVAIFFDSDRFAFRPFNQQLLVDALEELCIEPPSTTWDVCIPLTSVALPLRLTRTVWKGSSISNGRILHNPPTSSSPDHTLSGLACVVEATHEQEAARLALQAAQAMLETMRLRHHVRPFLSGDISVTRVSDALETRIPLPHPFWDPDGSQRRRPSLPGAFGAVSKRLIPGDRAKWEAAKWHLSQALADWPEDVHAGSARVWQAIESFGASIVDVASILIRPYLNAEFLAMVENVAQRVSRQAHHCWQAPSLRSRKIDWKRWNHKTRTADQWLIDVMNQTAHTPWCVPEGPMILFDSKVGILPTLTRRLIQPHSSTWFERRLSDDMELLYALRNAVVHRGDRTFTPRMAEYLGRTGAELLLTVMHSITAAAVSLPATPEAFSLHQLTNQAGHSHR